MFDFIPMCTGSSGKERESNHDDLASFQKLEDEWRKNGHIYDQKRKGTHRSKFKTVIQKFLG